MHAHTNAYCVEGSKAPSDSAARGVPASPVIRLVAAPTPSHSGVSALTARLSAATCDPIPPVDHPFALHLLRLFSALSASRSLGRRCPVPLEPPSADWPSSHAFRASPPLPRLHITPSALRSVSCRARSASTSTYTVVRSLHLPCPRVLLAVCALCAPLHRLRRWPSETL